MEEEAERQGEKRRARGKEGEVKTEHRREEMSTHRAQCEH